jgi:hypothetical protein
MKINVTVTARTDPDRQKGQPQHSEALVTASSPSVETDLSA